MTRRRSRPRSTAKTAYGLLGEIQRLIVEEPKRYNQHQILILRRPDATYRDVVLRDGVLDLIGDELTRDARVELAMPDCGTIGCVAGWTVALTSSRPGRVDDVLGRATKVLGLNDLQADKLFDGDAVGEKRQQSPEEHARRGAAHIARFRKRYRGQLIAKKLAR